MKRFLKIALQNEIFNDGLLPEVSNKRFFSRKATIRNHMAHSRRRLLLIDEEYLQHRKKNERKEVIQQTYFSNPKAQLIQLMQIQLLKTVLIPMMIKISEWEQIESTSLLFGYRTDWQSIFLLVKGMSWFFQMQDIEQQFIS